MAEKQTVVGTCKLTRQRGKYVAAHLIPKALTKLGGGGPYIQVGAGSRPVRRWSSWYDSGLVTQAGEQILAELDSWAISELRKHKLIWSSWGQRRTLGDLHKPIGDSAWGIRKVEGIDPATFRLFFLSLLWRAAATARSEFETIQIPAEDLEQLRIMLCSRNPEPVSFYPTQLTQLSTKGLIHNHAPVSDVKSLPALGKGGSDWKLLIFRFYLDGLIAHVHRHASDNGQTARLGNLIVGAEKTLILSTQTYEDSLQESKVSVLLNGLKGVRKLPRHPA